MDHTVILIVIMAPIILGILKYDSIQKAKEKKESEQVNEFRKY